MAGYLEYFEITRAKRQYTHDVFVQGHETRDGIVRRVIFLFWSVEKPSPDPSVCLWVATAAALFNPTLNLWRCDVNERLGTPLDLSNFSVTNRVMVKRGHQNLNQQILLPVIYHF